MCIICEALIVGKVYRIKLGSFYYMKIYYLTHAQSITHTTFLVSVWKVGEAFIKKISTKTDDYETILKTIRDFLTQAFTATIKNRSFDSKWSSAENK